MANLYNFNAMLSWHKPTDEDLKQNKKSYKNHKVAIQFKPDITISAAKTFKGDASFYNPEDLLLSSLVSCHFMSYLYCCSVHKIDVVNYTDNAEAVLEVLPDGSGKIIKAILRPKVTILDTNQKELALELHKQANKLCFIANSCNFKIIYEPVCEVL